MKHENRSRRGLTKPCQNNVGILVHLTECDNFLTKILDRAADEVDCIIDYQKPVMHIRAMSYFYGRILGVVSAQIIGDLRMARIGIDCGRYSFLSFCQNFQYPVVNIVINENDSS